MKKSNIDLNAMSTLLAVTKAGGFAVAARQLGVPANQISRQIQRLEGNLGIRLLNRTTRRLSLTSAGKALIEGAEPALLQLDSLWRQAGAQAGEPGGHLRVAAPADFMTVLAPERLAQFIGQYPALSVEILLSDDIADLFSSSIDMAIRAGPIKDENLVARHLGASKLIVVASPQLIATHGVPDCIEQLASYPCLAARSRMGRALWSLTGPEGAVTIQIVARLTINGMGALIDATTAGLGAACVPEKMVLDRLDSGELVQLFPEYYRDGGGIYVVYPSHRHPTAGMRVFVDFLLQAAKD